MKISTQLFPVFSSTPLARLPLSVGVCALAIAFSTAVLPKLASAQSAASLQSPSDVTSQQSEQDGIGHSGDLNIFDIIHRAQTGTGELTDPSQSITDAATRYRLEQQRRLGISQPSDSEQLVKPENQGTNSPVRQ